VRVVADQHGNPTYAPHLASALLELARQISVTPSEQTAWGIYHAAGAGAATWHGLASEIVARGLNGGAPAVEAIQSSEYPSIAPRPRNSELDSAKFARTFGLRLPPWQEGVAACVLQLSGA
jgi:dTDP-4-dehydrorhamnose reductase